MFTLCLTRSFRNIAKGRLVPVQTVPQTAMSAAMRLAVYPRLLELDAYATITAGHLLCGFDLNQSTDIALLISSSCLKSELFLFLSAYFAFFAYMDGRLNIVLPLKQDETAKE